ncbi:EAL domain-containing protein [Devosia sp.]|uniref:putative bifunctional diguanylate cyclase/phosphodiesterase n=1 Tax=Devosia sp. TaxID=1871048 RepID=UPI0032679A39
MSDEQERAPVLTSARKSMPTLEYVSMVRSVYGDRRAMLAGTFASSLTALLTAFKTGSALLYLVTAGFLLIGLLRYVDMRAFWRAAIDSDDADAAELWENRAVVTGGLLAVVFGVWCLFSMAVVKDPFAELASASLTIAAMVGVCGRNFGLDRLVTIQMVGVIVPLSAGYALHGDVYHVILAALLLIMLSSFRKLAGDIRNILLSAVHGRHEASRLAAELDMAMGTMQHGLCMLDERGIVTVANERAVRAFAQLEIPNLIGRQFLKVLEELGSGGQLPNTAVDRLLDMLAKRASGKVLLCLPQAQYYEVTVSSRQERSVLLFENISDRVAAEERINFIARHDPLTGLPNRGYFGEMIAEDLALRDTEIGPTRPIALMIVDLDDFKHVNDTLGHMVGDQLLADVAQRLRAAAPPEAILARLGGDEFIVYLNAATDPAKVQHVADTIINAFHASFTLNEIILAANVSIGLVISDAPSDQLDALMTKADLALYIAKGNGKGRSQLFHAQMDTDYLYRQRLKTDLREAIRSRSLSLVFQPQVDIATRRVVSCEALARWQHPTLGAIPPMVFIPLAEEIGLISEITAFVLEAATTQCTAWPGDIGVAVNISARDFRGGDIGGMVARALLASGLPPSRLEVEVTETALIEERDIAMTVLKALAAQGISIALDDFGTGYSSLSYLNTLPFNKLKIDRSFVADVATNPRSLKLLANVARLGRDLGLTVTAEGIETEDQLQALLSHTRVGQVQGYLFARPLPPRDIAELITRFNAEPKRPAIRKHG